MEKICGIYLIENIRTGQKYIGQSIDIYKRWNQHCNYSKKNTYIDNCIRKYGKNNFRLILLEKLPSNKELLNNKEKYWIKKYGTYENPNHYNLTPGGECLIGKDNPFYGKKHSDVSKKKMSESRKGKKLTEKHKQKISNATKGMNNPMYGKKHTKQALEKMSSIKKGKSYSENQKLNMSLSKNTLGYYRVTKRKDSHCKQGFVYAYQYPEYNGGRQKAIVSTQLEDLEVKVKNKGLLWKKLN